MLKIKHFIITQFNLQLWTKDKKNRPTYTDSWLARRFVLFDTYCFPSINKQTDTNFIWICLFDAGTPDSYREKINYYQSECPQFLPCFLGEEETKNWLEFTKNIIRENLSSEDDFIVTTNIDNDDAVHLKMIEQVQANIRQSPGEILYSFNYGYQYFPDSGILLKMKYPHNHFLSLVEKNKTDFNTIKSMPHAKARKHYVTCDLKTEPYWIELVHTSNVNNDLRITSRIKYQPVYRTIHLKDFGLDIVLKGSSNTKANVFKLPALFLKTAYVRLKRKIAKSGSYQK